MTHDLAPVLSIIIPVLNARSNLERLLHSIERVSPEGKTEVIVCDNGSTDGTPERASGLGARVLSLPGETIAGLRNCGAAVARARWLAFVDSDCEVLSGWWEAGCAALQGTGVVGAGCWPPPPLHCTWVQERVSLGARLNPPIGPAPWIPSMNLFVDRGAFERVGGFDRRLQTCEDVDLCYRLRDLGGKLIWDTRITALHHGEPETLRRLFLKERWHGLDNYSGIKSHGLRLEEMPGLLLPPVLLASLVIPGLSAGLLPFVGPLPLLGSLPLLGLLPGLALTRAGLRAIRGKMPQEWAPLGVIQSVYCAARVAALVDTAVTRSSGHRILTK